MTGHLIPFKTVSRDFDRKLYIQTRGFAGLTAFVVIFLLLNVDFTGLLTEEVYEVVTWQSMFVCSMYECGADFSVAR